MIVMSGSVSRNAMLDLRRMSLRSVVRLAAAGRRTAPIVDVSTAPPPYPRGSGAHKAFQFGRRPRDRLVHRLAALRVLGHQLGCDRLSVDLRADLRRRRIRGHGHDLTGARRIMIK